MKHKTMKHNIKIIWILTLLLAACTTTLDAPVEEQKAESPVLTSIYDLSLEDLMSINVISDTNALDLQPDYDIPIEDLMKLEIVREIKQTERFTISYDIPLEDLLKIQVPVKRHNGIASIDPTYEMSLQGLLELEIKQDYDVKTLIKISYDISIEGLMQIDLADMPDEE